MSQFLTFVGLFDKVFGVSGGYFVDALMPKDPSSSVSVKSFCSLRGQVGGNDTWKIEGICIVVIPVLEFCLTSFLFDGDFLVPKYIFRRANRAQRAYRLAFDDSNLIDSIRQNRWPCEMFPGICNVPHDGNRCEPGKHDACVVHGSWCDRYRNWHAEQHGRKTNPANGDNVDDESKFAKRERRVLYRFPTTEDVDKNRNAVGC